MCLGSIYPIPDTRLLILANQIVALRQLTVTHLHASRALRDSERASQLWPTTIGLCDMMRHQLHLLSRELLVARDEVLDSLYDAQLGMANHNAERCAKLRACLDGAYLAWGMDTDTLDHDVLTASASVADVVNDILWRHTGTRPMPNDHDDVM